MVPGDAHFLVQTPLHWHFNVEMFFWLNDLSEAQLLEAEHCGLNSKS